MGQNGRFSNIAADAGSQHPGLLLAPRPSGAVSQKTLLERKYAKEKLEVLMNVQREALRLEIRSFYSPHATTATSRLPLC